VILWFLSSAGASCPLYHNSTSYIRHTEYDDIHAQQHNYLLLITKCLGAAVKMKRLQEKPITSPNVVATQRHKFPLSGTDGWAGHLFSICRGYDSEISRAFAHHLISPHESHELLCNYSAMVIHLHLLALPYQPTWCLGHGRRWSNARRHLTIWHYCWFGLNHTPKLHCSMLKIWRFSQDGRTASPMNVTERLNQSPATNVILGLASININCKLYTDTGGSRNTSELAAHDTDSRGKLVLSFSCITWSKGRHLLRCL